jgi:hypothetical protein
LQKFLAIEKGSLIRIDFSSRVNDVNFAICFWQAHGCYRISDFPDGAMDSMIDAAPAPSLLARAIDRPASVLSLILAASVTECLVNVLPSFVGALADVLGFSAQRIGLLASADLAGIALASASAPWWLRESSWRRTALGSLSVLVVLNFACLGVTRFLPLLMLRLLAGLATGTAFSIALAGVLDTRKADRNTGLMVCMQVVVGAAGVYIRTRRRADWVAPRCRLSLYHCVATADAVARLAILSERPR